MTAVCHARVIIICINLHKMVILLIAIPVQIQVI